MRSSARPASTSAAAETRKKSDFVAGQPFLVPIVGGSGGAPGGPLAPAPRPA